MGLRVATRQSTARSIGRRPRSASEGLFLGPRRSTKWGPIRGGVRLGAGCCCRLSAGRDAEARRGLAGVASGRRAWDGSVGSVGEHVGEELAESARPDDACPMACLKACPRSPLRTRGWRLLRRPTLASILRAEATSEEVVSAADLDVCCELLPGGCSSSAATSAAAAAVAAAAMASSAATAAAAAAFARSCGRSLRCRKCAAQSASQLLSSPRQTPSAWRGRGAWKVWMGSPTAFGLPTWRIPTRASLTGAAGASTRRRTPPPPSSSPEARPASDGGRGMDTAGRPSRAGAEVDAER